MGVKIFHEILISLSHKTPGVQIDFLSSIIRQYYYVPMNLISGTEKHLHSASSKRHLRCIFAAPSAPRARRKWRSADESGAHPGRLAQHIHARLPPRLQTLPHWNHSSIVCLTMKISILTIYLINHCINIFLPIFGLKLYRDEHCSIISEKLPRWTLGRETLTPPIMNIFSTQLDELYQIVG